MAKQVMPMKGKMPSGGGKKACAKCGSMSHATASCNKK